MATVAVRCPECGASCTDLTKHFRQSPPCDTRSGETPPVALHSCAEPISERATLFKNQFAAQLVTDFEDLHYRKFVAASSYEEWQTKECGRLDLIESYMADEFQRKCSSQVVCIMHAIFKEVREVMQLYRSKAAIKRYAIQVQKVGYVAPIALDSSMPEDKWRKNAASLSLKSLIVRQMQHSDEARRHILEKSTEWKSGKYYKVRPQVLSDTCDGDKVRMSWIMERSDDPKEVRVLVQGHNDDITLTNPLGTKRGEHKVSVTSLCICNLPLRMRYSWQHVMPVSVVNSKVSDGMLISSVCTINLSIPSRARVQVVKTMGLSYAIAGVNKDGHVKFQDSLAAELREAEKGFEAEVPDDLGRTRRVTIRVFLVNFAADWLAAQGLGPNVESTSANLPCTHCWWQSFAADKRQTGNLTAHAGTSQHASCQNT